MFFFKRKKLAEIEEKLDKVMELLEKQEQKSNDRENRNRQFLCELFEKKTEVLLNENKDWIEIIEAVLQDTESKLSDTVGQNMEEFKELNIALDKHAGAVKEGLKSVQRDMEKEQERGREAADKLELAENRVLEMLENLGQEANKRESNNRQFLYELLEKKTELLLNENKEQIEIMEAALQDAESRLFGAAGKNMKEFAEFRMALNKHDEAIKNALKSVRRDMEKEQEREKETVEKLELAENEIRMLLLNSVMDQLP